MLEKAAALKSFECSPLGKELKKQTSVVEKKYQKFDRAFESNRNEEVETKNKRSLAKSNLVYNNYLTFYIYIKIKVFAKRYFVSKLDDLNELKDYIRIILL